MKKQIEIIRNLGKAGWLIWKAVFIVIRVYLLDIRISIKERFSKSKWDAKIGIMLALRDRLCEQGTELSNAGIAICEGMLKGDL